MQNYAAESVTLPSISMPPDLRRAHQALDRAVDAALEKPARKIKRKSL